MAFIQYLARIQIDPGARKLLSAELARQGVVRPLIVSDRGVVGAGVLDRALAAHEPAASWPRFIDVPANPTVAAATEALNAYREADCDGFVAIGGGSVIDCAKGAALMLTHDAPIETLLARRGGIDRIDPVAPIIAMPTISGTGTEIGRGMGLTLDDGEKGVFLSPNLIPRVAICDPDLTASAPARLKAGSGIDALGHALEAYLSPAYNPPADAIALDAIARLVRWLPRAVGDADDAEARFELMMGTLEAAMSMWKGLGAAHALSMPFDDLGLHHGTLVGVLMPEALRFVLPSVPEARLRRLADALGCAVAAIPPTLADLNRRIGLPMGLAAMGVPESCLERAGEIAAATPFNETAARRGSAEDYAAIARAAFQ
jgi:4-hydroxybutyrate dehydrogenase